MIFAAVEWMRVFREAAELGYLLAGFSIVAVFIICERTYALQRSAIIPDDLADSVLLNKPVVGGSKSALSRIIDFTEEHPDDADGAKAYARLEVIKMERGVSYLDVIYTGAPLLGLIGTVRGLINAFNVVDPETRMPDPVQFTHSVSYALSATMLGLIVAMIALLGSGYLQRKIDHHAAQLDVLLERVLARKSKQRGVQEVAR